MAKSTEELDQLIKESEEALRKLEKAQEGRKVPLSQRLASHLKKNGNTVINLLLAANVLEVALGRLEQKHEQKEEQKGWEEERRKLTVERNRMQEQLHAYKLSTESFIRQVEAAAAGGGRHLADDVRGILQKHREAQAQLEQQSPAVAALLHTARQQQQMQAAAAAGQQPAG